jgi:hypothetical protein
MDDLWGPIHINKWHLTPCVRSRIAIEQNVRDGFAVFYFSNAAEIEAVPADIGVPRLATRYTEGEAPQTVVIIQSEQAGDKHYIGYRTLTGGNGMCFRHEVELHEP